MHWRRKDGERIVVKVTFSLVRDSARQILGFSVIAREFDCTAAELSGRRQAEESARKVTVPVLVVIWLLSAYRVPVAISWLLSLA